MDRRDFARALSAFAAAPFIDLRGPVAIPMPVSPGAQEQGGTPTPWVDGLSFMPEDLADIRRSGLSAFILDVSAGEQVEVEGETRFVRTFDASARSLVAMRRTLRETEGAFLATRGSDVLQAHRQGRTAVFLQFQGCEPLEGDLTKISLFYELGLRILQITHHYDNRIGGGALEPEPRGLTEVGFSAIEEMGELGILPDLSHASDLTARDVLRASRGPAIVSHTGARALVPNARCTPDDVIRGVADSGGVVGIFMMSFWLTTDPVPQVDHLIRQLRHVADVGGIDAVGIANDFPLSGEAHLASLGNDNDQGVRAYHPWWQRQAKRGIRGFERLPEHVVIPELNDIRRMYTIHDALGSGGFTPREIEKIMGGNWTRVLTQALG